MLATQNTRGGGRDFSRGGGGRGNQFGRRRQNDYSYNRNVRPRYHGGDYQQGGGRYGGGRQYAPQGRGNYLQARGYPPQQEQYQARANIVRGGGGGGRGGSPGRGRDGRGQRDGRGGRGFTPRREAYVAEPASNHPTDEDPVAPAQDDLALSGRIRRGTSGIRTASF